MSFCQKNKMCNKILCDINSKLVVGEGYSFMVEEYASMNRVELMGRLVYCGFEIVEADDKVVRVRKVRDVVAGDCPERDYGWIVKLRRVGKNGRRFNIYKIRTMYPYAEYLQKWMYEQYNLDEKGKIANDFRITPIGRWLRRLWIDELPNFWNLVRGEMKLVGVRPLSEHYYSLYREEVQQARIKYKPGLLPPFYADRPSTLDEIQESEMRYLEACDRDGVNKTDWWYFWRIIFK